MVLCLLHMTLKLCYEAKRDKFVQEKEKVNLSLFPIKKSLHDQNFHWLIPGPDNKCILEIVCLY